MYLIYYNTRRERVKKLEGDRERDFEVVREKGIRLIEQRALQQTTRYLR